MEQIIHAPRCAWETGPNCDCGADPARAFVRESMCMVCATYRPDKCPAHR